MIISVRGTNGSGKSHAVRAVMAMGTSKPLMGMLGFTLPEAYELTLPGVTKPVFVIGPYADDGFGGCDLINKITSTAPDEGFLTNVKRDSVETLIEKYAQRGHVLFEGVVVSYMYGAIGLLMEQWGKDSIFVFLDTPLEECIKRVEKRRARKRDERLINNMTRKYEFGLRVQKKVEREGKMRAVSVSSEAAPKAIYTLLVDRTYSKVSKR